MSRTVEPRWHSRSNSLYFKIDLFSHCPLSTFAAAGEESNFISRRDAGIRGARARVQSKSLDARRNRMCDKGDPRDAVSSLFVGRAVDFRECLVTIARMWFQTRAGIRPDYLLRARVALSRVKASRKVFVPSSIPARVPSHVHAPLTTQQFSKFAYQITVEVTTQR